MPSIKTSFDNFRKAMQKPLSPMWGTMRLVIEAHGERHESPGQQCLVTFEIKRGGEIAASIDRTLSFKAEHAGTPFLEFRNSVGDFICRRTIESGRENVTDVRAGQTVTITSRRT